MRRSLPLVSLVAALVVLFAAPPPAGARVPRGFVGMGIDGPFFYPDMDENAQMNKIVASGVQSVRTLFDWAGIQPYPDFASVPPALRSKFVNIGGVPTNFSLTDQVVGLAASHGLTVLPVLEYAPTWDSTHPGSPGAPPSSTAAYAKFAAALVHRYGPTGSYWGQNPQIRKIPITMWQIWNEPNFTVYWSRQPFERGYVKLLRAAHNAIKAADRSAKVVLAGLTNFSWRYLTQIYKIRGARGLFDIVAAHPYTANPSGVVTILEKVRAVMARFGDRKKPIIASEISWPSAKGQAITLFENATTEAGQARKTGEAVRLLARDRKKLGLRAFYYFTWITNETQPGARADPFNFAGLFRFINGVGTFQKPAYPAFVRAVRAIER
jgi:hypothetical protein